MQSYRPAIEEAVGTAARAIQDGKGLPRLDIRIRVGSGVTAKSIRAMRANDSQTTKTRHVVVQVECRLDEGTLANFPGVEFYHADGPDTENQTDMALLNDLEMPIKLAFVGGDEARRLAELYGGRWVEDVRTADSSFWGEFRQVTRRAQDSGG